MSAIRLRVHCCVVALSVLVLACQSRGQSPAPPASSHLPPAIANAKSVFLSNEDAQTGIFPSPYSGGTDRAYEQLYAALQSSGRFTLVDQPAEADLVLAIKLIAPQNLDWMPAHLRTVGEPVVLPYLRLTIYDRPTHYVLWTLTEPIETALLQRNSDKNFDQSVKRLAGDLLTLAGKAPAVAATAP